MLEVGSARSGQEVTPHDTTALSGKTRGLYVGGAGDVTVTMHNGSDLTFVGVPAGTILPIVVTHVKSTGTDATDIVALF